MGKCCGLWATPSALAVSATTAGSTPPTQSRPRGSRVLRNPCSRVIFCGRKFLIFTRYSGNTTPRLPREGAVSRRRRETEGVALGRSVTAVLRLNLRETAYKKVSCNRKYPGNAEGNSLSLSGVCGRSTQSPLPRAVAARRGICKCRPANWANGLRPKRTSSVRCCRREGTGY